MKHPESIGPARAASILAIAAALAIPWYGWLAAGAAVFMVLLGALLAPHQELPHRSRLRLLTEAVRRRFARSPWRAKRL
jgi:hypothetical protein